MNTKSIKLIIFDFDGVIADSFHAIYSVVRDAFKYVGIPLSEQEYRNFFLINPKLAEKKLCKNEKKFNKVQKFIHENAPKRYRDVKIFPEMLKTIPRLALTTNLAIVSSSQTDIIIEKLKKYKLLKYFSLILGADKDLSKIKKLNNIIHHFGLQKKSIFFISDTFGDIKEGKKIGIKTIAVAWGFHDIKTINKAQPNAILLDGKKLLKYLQNN